MPAGGGSGLGIGTGSSTGAAIAGAIADYNFLQGSGTALTDITGNGNNGTLGSGTLAPSWTANGLQFASQQNVSLPAALNPAKTFFIGVYLNPLTDSTNTAFYLNNSYPAIVSSSLDNAGTNLLYWQDIAGTGYTNTGIFSPSIFANGVGTFASDLLSGFHVLTYVLGTGGTNGPDLYRWE